MPCLDCNDGNLPTTLGQEGTSTFVYIGFADDNVGSNFSLEQDGRCYISFLTSDTDLSNVINAGYFTNGWTNICCTPCEEEPQTPITPANTSTVNMAASGLNDHTIQSDVNVSGTANNLLTIETDGLYVENPSIHFEDLATAYIQDHIPDLTWNDPLFTLNETSVNTIVENNIIDIFDASNPFVNLTNTGTQYEITNISLELLQDTLATSFLDLTYDDANDWFIFTPGNDGDVWTTSGGVAQWLPNTAGDTNITTIYVSYSINPTLDCVILANAGGSPLVVTLPDATTVAKKEFTIKLVNNANPVLINTSGGWLDNAANKTLSNPMELITVKSDGTDYWIINGYNN
jgi:hypothetical protein